MAIMKHPNWHVEADYAVITSKPDEDLSRGFLMRKLEMFLLTATTTHRKGDNGISFYNILRNENLD